MESSTITVLPKGYVGKRQPESWSLEKLLDNMNKALALPSSYDLITQKVERGRGPRNVYTMVVEQLLENPVVKIYYDWDFTCKGLTNLTQIHTQEELNAVLDELDDIQLEELATFTLALKRAHPDVPETDFAFAKRTGWKVKKTSSGWFVSLRCFVQGKSMHVGDIRRHIDNVFAPDEFTQLDRNVYKKTEQCLALVGGHKEAGDKRVLVPLTHTDDLEAFVVQSTANCELMSPFAAEENKAPHVPQKRTLESAPQGSSSRPRTNTTDNAALEWIHQQFDVEPSLILLDKVTSFHQGAATQGYSIPTSSRLCPFIRREHASNHVYFTVNLPRCGTGYVKIQMKCHDAECAHLFRGPSNNAPVSPDVQQGFLDLLQTIEKSPTPTTDENTTVPVSSTTVTLNLKKETVRQSLAEFQKMYPEMDCTIDDDDDILQPTTLGNGGFMTYLKKNHFCPLHTRMHDTCENCVLFSTQPSVQNGVVVNTVKQQLLCRRDMNVTLPYPMDKSQTNIIFANINNISINLTTDALEIRDFGTFDNFPKVHADDNLNQRCFQSLKGQTREVAHYAVHMMQGKLVFQSSTWYRFTGRFWKVCSGPDDLLTIDLVEVYTKLQRIYTGEKQLRWIQNLISDLTHMSKRKAFIEDMERIVFDHGDVLPLDMHSTLIGFQNGTFDATNCHFREHRMEDYLTDLLSYDLPATADPDICHEINTFMEGIMPDKSVRDFLWLMLSFHLCGENEKSVAMIWTGSGGNGKSILKRLMSLAFETMHSEPSATFLTSERPSPEKPAPHLVKLKNCRSVFASEPEANKKINTGFLKFITGNDIVECRACHTNEILKFYPRFLITLLCNAIPLFQGGGEETRGLWRRLHIISFEQEFVAEPKLAHQRKDDPTLKKRMDRWPPHFMRMLIEVFKSFVDGGRVLTVPPKVQMNLEEQKDENTPIDSWLEENLERGTEDDRIHLHRLSREFEQAMERLSQIEKTERPRAQQKSATVMEQKLRGLGFILTKNSERQRDQYCACNSTCRYVKDAKIRGQARPL